MARITLDPLRGFRDLLHPESTMLSRLASIFAELAEAHGYTEVKPPTLERFEIFALKSGEEIRRSMYVFRDKAGREVALRPEATASVARIYLRHLRGHPKPIRLYYIINCFRYEEPQRARYREFWQAGVEHLGTPGIEGDFEVIKLLIAFYKKIGFLDKIVLKIGTTRLYRILFNKHQVPEELQDHVLHLMDKSLYQQAIDALEERGYQELAETLSKIWSRKHDPEKVAEIAASETEEAKKAVEELAALVAMLREYSPETRIEIDLSFARGLAYYTGTIFEVKVPGFPVSIAGGGRYDGLIRIYGDEDVPGTGFAIGLDRTLAAMQDKGVAEALLPQRSHAAIIVMEPKLIPYAAKVQDALMTHGVTTSLTVTKKLQKILPKLARQGVKYAAIIGAKEADKEEVTIRDLETRTQATIPLKLLAEKGPGAIEGHSETNTQ